MSYYKRNARYRKRTAYNGYKKRRGGRKNYVPLLKAIFVFFLSIFVIVKLFGFLFSGVNAEQVGADMVVEVGSIEYFFPKNKDWLMADTGNKFREGDRIRTKAGSKGSLELFSGNFVFLNENTELEIKTLETTSSGIKKVILVLESGEIWVKTSPEYFSEESKSQFKIETPRSVVSAQGTFFDLLVESNREVVRLMQGTVNVDIQGPDDTIWNKLVDVGQQLVIDDTTIGKLESGLDVKESIDPNFVESEWNIGNIERFSPEEAVEIRRRIEMKTAPISGKEGAPEEEKEPTIVADEDLPRPSFISPTEGERIPAQRGTVTIEGIAPENTFQIVVNGYTLNKFNPGDQKWRYIASTEFGTLLPGENKYEVVSVFRDGRKSLPVVLNIVYDGVAQIESPSTAAERVTSVMQSSMQEFKAPVITRPVAIKDGGTYETSAPSFSFVGLVDPKTNQVIVNDYRLQKFAVGNTQFRYTVNAESRPPNMVEGRNTYTIKALGPDGKSATTTIYVDYTPLSFE